MNFCQMRADDAEMIGIVFDFRAAETVFGENAKLGSATKLISNVVLPTRARDFRMEAASNSHGPNEIEAGMMGHGTRCERSAP